MSRKRVIEQGDSIDSIAFGDGFFWKTLWNDPRNKELRNQRPDPDILYPGDIVVIPDKRGKEETGSTGSRHKFRRKGVPARLTIQFLDEHEYMANKPFTAEVDGKTMSGTLDDQGVLDIPVSPDAADARIRLGNEGPLMFSLGALDPVSEVAGAQERLANLNYYSGEIDGIAGLLTEQGVMLFQDEQGLEVTGHLDAKTIARLQEIHDSK